MRKGLRLIDPELRERGREKQQSDDEVLGRLWLLAAEDKKGETGDESGEDQRFDQWRIFETAQQFIPCAAAACFARQIAAGRKWTEVK